MKKVKCRVAHNPPEQHGDCIRACIESITGLSDVPHCFKPDTEYETSWRFLKAHLQTEGFDLCLIPLEENPFEYMKINNKNIPYLLIGKTPKNVNHCVVAINDEIYNNPDRSSQPLVKPCAGKYWVIGIIVRT